MVAFSIYLNRRVFVITNYQLLVPLVTDQKEFLKSTNPKILLKEHFSHFHNNRHIEKQRNIKLSVWIILALW